MHAARSSISLVNGSIAFFVSEGLDFEFHRGVDVSTFSSFDATVAAFVSNYTTFSNKLVNELSTSIYKTNTSMLAEISQAKYNETKIGSMCIEFFVFVGTDIWPCCRPDFSDKH